MSGKAIRETLAAVGVIASMVFVGWEIRQSTTVARAATRNEVAVQIVDLLRDVSTDPLLADIMGRRHNGEELSEAENRQFNHRATAMFRYFENVHYQYRQDLYAESEYMTQREAWRSFLRAEGYEENWCSGRDLYSPEFRVAFDDLLPNGC